MDSAVYLVGEKLRKELRLKKKKSEKIGKTGNHEKHSAL